MKEVDIIINLPKFYLIIFIIGVILLSPFYYLEYLKPLERKKDYSKQGTMYYLFDDNSAIELYRFTRDKRTIYKLRYQNKNGRYVEDNFYSTEIFEIPRNEAE